MDILLKQGKKTKGKKKGRVEAPAHSHDRVLEADGSINVSQSKVKSWRHCHRQYHNRYVLGLQKKKIKRPFMFGSIIHNMAEADFEGKDPMKVLDAIEIEHRPMFRKEVEMYGDIIQDIRDVMGDYFEHWQGDVKPIKGPDGSFAEHEFRIELDDQLWFTGKIDAVVKAKRMKWLMEHKSFARMPSEDDRWRSVQAATYMRALEYMGGWPEIDGILWDYVSSKPPSVPSPDLLNNGKHSLAKINTVPTRLERWLKEEKLKKQRDYFKKLIDEAKANRRSYFIRLYNPVKPRVVDYIWNDFVDTAHEIQEKHGKLKDQNIGWACKMCDYQPLCRAQAYDTDVDYVLKTEYTTVETHSLLGEKERADDD